MSQSRKAVAAQQDLISYPSMTSAEVVECLQALGINAQGDDLLKPTAQTAQGIFCALLDTLMAAPIEAMEQPRQTLLGTMEYRELYGDSLQFTMFFRHCRDLANLCGVPNFSMADLTRPEPTRLRLVLAGILNLAKFRDERANYHNSLVANLRAQSDNAVRLRRNLDKIEYAIAEITEKSAEERPKTDAAREQNQKLRDELLDLRSQQVKLSQEVEELKRDRQAAMEQASSKVRELSVLQQQTSNTRSRLVQSPDRIKKHISEMSSMLSAERATHAAFVRKARELGNRLEVIGALETEVRRLAEVERDIEQLKAKVDEARRAEGALKARIEQKDIEHQGLGVRHDQLGRQLQNASDKLNRQQDMGREMRERAQAKITSLKSEYVVRSKERNHLQKERDALLAEQKELEAQMDAYVATHEAEINGLLNEYWTMRKQAEDYMNTMTVKLGLSIRA
ncbi:kinetochore-associated Ndc80 complex subunit nuf2 [Cryptotrichosporon argae]